MCDLENGIIKTGLPTQTVEQIITRSFDGILAHFKQRYESYLVPLDAQLTPEQIAHTRNWSRLEVERGMGIGRANSKKVQYRPMAYVSCKDKEVGSDWEVDGDLYVARFFENRYAGLFINPFCAPGSQRGITQTDLQKQTLDGFVAEFHRVVERAEVAYASVIATFAKNAIVPAI